jgi:uncharacterized protein YecE (DUF72 family)
VDPKKVIPIRQASLFEVSKPEPPDVAIAADSAPVERPYGDENILLGTSAFTANGWAGSFYPAGTKPSDRLSYYASRFATVEIDSTFYGTPTPETVSNWYLKTPPDFVFAAKVPQIVTHEKMMVDCEVEFDEFVDRMQILDSKLGPLLLQFPKFSKYVMNENEFLRRLRFLLARVKNSPVRFVVEIRNKPLLTERLLDVLRENRVALALSDTNFMPRPWEQKLDLITTDFAYVRLLGDRKGIERETTVWDKVIADRTEELDHWVDLFGQIRRTTADLKIYAYANNHYQGHGPATVKLLWDSYKEAK